MTIWLYFFKQIFYDLWNYAVNMISRSILNSLRSLHGKSFSRSSLSISKNCTMISFHSFINHRLNFTLFINILLRIWLSKKIIKMKFSNRGRLLFNIDLFFILINLNKWIFKALFFLWWKKWSYTNCCFYFIRHVSKKINLIDFFYKYYYFY